MATRPNILLFIPDAMQAQTMLPGSPCQTPHMDRLAGRGVSFRRAYCATPTCSPSRASLMTGLLPHNHGVLEVEHVRDYDQCVLRTDKPHFAQQLAAADYATGYFGKWHVERSNQLEHFGWHVNGVKSAEHVKHLGKGDAGSEPVDPADSRWVEGPVPGYNRVLHYGITDVAPKDRYPHYTGDQALAFLNDHRKSGDGDPWCCCVSFSEPNEALVVSRETMAKYDLGGIDLPENRHDDHAGKPALYQRQKAISAAVTDDEWRKARACYYGRVTEVDLQLGRLLDWLDETGEAANTIVVVTSDHGRYVGAHGFDAHNCGAYEEIYRIPMIIAGPGVAKAQESEALVQFADLCPTLIELAGAEALPDLDFRSFAPVLKEPAKTEAFQTAYGEYHGTRFPLCQRIYWEGDWKFVFNGFDFDELYDLANDPLEMTNLVTLPEHQGRVERMMAGVWQRVRDSGDRAILESHYYSMRFAAAGPGVAG